MTARAVCLLFLLGSLLTVATPAGAARCDTDVVPAATLLFPYFEVDLAAPNQQTTLLSVTNRDKEPVLARVTLWTDWAVPTLAFDLYLAGHDIQTLNLRDVLVQGLLPATGSAVSPHGRASGEPVSFPGCNDTTEAGAAPVYPAPALSAEALTELRAAHTGQYSPTTGLRSGARTEDRVARGYVTVDTVERCAELTPADPGYFAADGSGVASTRNALFGDYFFVDAAESFAQGEPAVHVEAFPGTFGAGAQTFYGRYVERSGADHREPLGTQYSVRHLLGGAFDGGTRLLVWRDTGSPAAEPIACDERYPDWVLPFGLPSYLALLDESGGGSETFIDACVTLPPCADFLLTRATQTLGYFHDDPAPTINYARPAPIPFGQTYVVLRRASQLSPPDDWPVLQGWVGVVHSAEDRYSVGLRAVRLDSACAPGPIEPAPEVFQPSAAEGVGEDDLVD